MQTEIPRTVMIKGAGDLASGVAHRLWRSGFNIIMLELPQPLAVRRAAAFAGAVFEGSWELEKVTARLCSSAGGVDNILSKKEIALLIDPDADAVKQLHPAVVVDAIMAKRNTGTSIEDASFVIGLGPGFTAGSDVHAVIETKRGHTLGSVFYAGSAAADTAEPGEIAGAGLDRLLRAPADGVFEPCADIGTLVKKGDLVARVGSEPLYASTSGLVRGLLYPGLKVTRGLKVGDIDPRGSSVNYHSISDKARSIGGAVLEAIMHRFFFQQNNVPGA